MRIAAKIIPLVGPSGAHHRNYLSGNAVNAHIDPDLKPGDRLTSLAPFDSVRSSGSNKDQ